MNTSSKAILAALLLAVPLPAPARVGDDGKPHVYVLDGGDTVEVEGDRPNRIRIAPFAGGPYLGIRLVEIPPDLRVHFGASKDAGVLVGEVEKDSPSARAGVEVGDVVTAVDGERVSSSWDLVRAVRRRATGDTVKLDVVRNRGTKSLSVKVEERPRQEVEINEMGRVLGRDIARELRSRPWTYQFDTGEMRMPRREREEVRRLQDRVDELEKRLKELEGRRSR